MEYAIVVFTDSDQVEVVSNIWFEGNRCCSWPNYRSSLRITKAVRVHEVPEIDWKAYPIRVLRLTGMFNFKFFQYNYFNSSIVFRSRFFDSQFYIFVISRHKFKKPCVCHGKR